METLRNLRPWLVRRWPLVIAVVILFLLWFMPELLTAPDIVVTHMPGSSTGHVDILWFRQDLSIELAANGNGDAFAVSHSGDRLIALDPGTGSTTIEHVLSYDERGVRDFLVGPDAIYIVKTTEVTAYDRTNLSRVWATELGQGHVGILSQLDGHVLRIYYGEQIYELDARTGRLLNVAPKDNTTWIMGNTILKGTSGFERDTGVLLWQQGPLFDPELGLPPQNTSQDQLLIRHAYGWDCSCGLCTLNMENGREDWCRPEEYISPVAIDSDLGRGYVMRSDLALLTLDMRTGEIIGQTSFLTSYTGRSYKYPDGGVVVAVSNHVAMVGFFDSGQTFGLSIR